MTATPARIGFVMQPVRRATAETPAVFARHGALARKDDEPVETFFENVADAEIVARERQALMSPERRRFAVMVTGLDQMLEAGIDTPAVLPKSRYIDEHRGVDREVVVAELGFDFARQAATIVVWG
jgi:hypothetical protein